MNADRWAYFPEGNRLEDAAVRKLVDQKEKGREEKREERKNFGFYS